MLTDIKVKDLYPHPQNPRKDVGDVSELADSIKNQGIFQNLTVIKGGAGVPDGIDGYTVIIGHRRLAASKLAGLEVLPCSVVEMDEKQQVATMLLENMQRTDLTVYEQAQGFQMMLDLGETQKSIAEKTGFSPATVSQRLQLIKLDQSLLEKASAKQISIVDLNKLNKIDDIEERNLLLKEIGTSNFEWKYKQALDKQKRDKKTKAWREVLLEAGLIEIDDHWDNKYESCERPWFSIEANPKEFVRADDEKYFHISYGSVYVRKDRVAKVETEEEKARKEKQKLENEIKQKLLSLSKIAYDMRKEFAENVSTTVVKKHFSDIIAFYMFKKAMSYEYIDEDDMAQLLGVEWEENEDESFISYDEVLNNVKKAPEKIFWSMVYMCADENSVQMSYYNQWDSTHKNNTQLDALYSLLTTLGYQMSDEEKQLQDGTHELFKVVTE